MQHSRFRFFESIHQSEPDRHTGLGRRLLEDGAIAPWQLFYAMARQKLWDASLVDILMSKGWITEAQKLRVMAPYFGTHVVDLEQAPPDDRLQGIIPPDLCLKYTLVPWIRLNGALTIATSRPEDFGTIQGTLPPEAQDAHIVLASENQIQNYVANRHKTQLALASETCVKPEESCRGWGRSPWRRYIGFALCAAMIFAAFQFKTGVAITALTLIAVTMQFMSAGMKISALFASRRFVPPNTNNVPPSKLPKISMLVPLYKETEIAGALIRRLSTLRYPHALLDVLLVLEEKDSLTRETLAKTNLPKWMRVIEVPGGSGLTTKPRALNYALDFCRGDIIGIWDAEDAPDPEQLMVIANQFAQADDDVACLQGILDYYNPYTNWLSRCFTLEYSMWFRVVLRGMSRLGAAIPLGGTTLFLRRDVIEKIGRWDAHNVTEDADLGVRLCCYGYRTELAFTVTQEEANCHMKRWVKQRSRWLKGYMITFLVHMRHPLRFYRRLGLRKFIGFNVIFLSTLAQFLLAPFIWSFWCLALGVSLPWFDGLPAPLMTGVIALFVSVSLLDTILAGLSMIGQKRNGLIFWAITLPIYFPLATLGAYKALFELIVNPFYWDKTAHGQTPEGQSANFSAIGA